MRLRSDAVRPRAMRCTGPLDRRVDYATLNTAIEDPTAPWSGGLLATEIAEEFFHPAGMSHLRAQKRVIQVSAPMTPTMMMITVNATALPRAWPLGSRGSAMLDARTRGRRAA
jgi:hypothetical protein